MDTTTRPDSTPRHTWDRHVVHATAGLLIIEAIAGTVALPDSWGLIALVTVTTLLLATRAVREWCLGRSNHAFELLIADHTPSHQ